MTSRTLIDKNFSAFEKKTSQEQKNNSNFLAQRESVV